MKKHHHHSKNIKFYGLENQIYDKKFIFSKVKFITDQFQFQDYDKKISIGYLFPQVMQQSHKETIDDVKTFWDSV